MILNIASQWIFVAAPMFLTKSPTAWYIFGRKYYIMCIAFPMLSTHIS